MASSEIDVLFSSGGELGTRMRNIDWSKTPLGPVERWPESLKTCVRIILTSRQPMFVWWGDQLINLYNDAYKTIVGGKHPQALGQPASVVWREIWDQVGPRVQSALKNNEGTYDESLLLMMERNGYPEETYYTFSYSPVPSEQGPSGIICANTEDTARIIGKRQLALLSQLADRTKDVRTPEQVCSRAATALETNPRDMPFALIYLIEDEGRRAVLHGSAGVEAGGPAAPAEIKLRESDTWPLAQVVDDPRVHVLTRSELPFAELPSGAWSKQPSHVALLPIAASGEHGRAGVLVAGLNPFRLFDQGYRDFLGLTVGQLASSIATADAYVQERKRAEALAELDRAKTAFFSNISHEFRTPLTLMLGPLEDAVNAGAGLGGENLRTAHRNALRLLKLVNALLDFSRIEAGRVEARYEPTDLAALTADLVSAFRSAIERAGLRFEVDLPKLDEPVYIDHDMWEKIVLNLLSNALKFTFEGAISVTLRSVADGVELSVSDTGTGIPESELSNVFKRFHRVPGSRSRTHEGSGIGLAMVHELVRLHGGTISVDSRFEHGTTFTIRLPMGAAHLPRERVGTGRVRQASMKAMPYVLEAERWLPDSAGPLATDFGQPSQAPLPSQDNTRMSHILLADDNADMREYLARLLRERWQVEAVADGREALDAVRRRVPDLILSDVMMPNLDGFGLLRALKEHDETKHVPFIMLSARAGDDAHVDGLEAGADDYLVKPFSGRELLARIATHLQLAALRRETERERERLFRVFMQAPAPIAVLVDSELKFEVANPAYCDMVGRSITRGQTLDAAFPELVGSEVLREIREVLDGKDPLHIDERLVPLVRGGALRDAYFNYAVQPLELSADQRAVVIVAYEVTEQVHARVRVARLRDEAEKASRAKDDFLSTLSHELRTPLNAIVGWSNLLRAGGLEPERASRALETIERNARIQARLIEDMLDLSRIEQGKLVLSVGPLELVRVVEAALEVVRPAAEAKGVRLQPVLDSHATIVGDADRLQQVVWNLLTNAIKFTPRHGRVHVRLRRHHSYVELAIADNGQGIEREFLPHVFERFRQADPSFTRKAGGLGLGLAIVRSIVELHGGTVEANSDGIGTGATFVVKLPMAPLRADKTTTPPADSEPGPRAGAFECPEELKGLNLLVVDDEPETRDLLQFLLMQCEATVTTVGSASEALRLLESNEFDLLVSDVGMPDMDGYALLRALRTHSSERGGTIPALALTAYARAEDRLQALKAGFNMHLSKPIEPTELLVVIATLVRDHLRRS